MSWYGIAKRSDRLSLLVLKCCQPSLVLHAERIVYAPCLCVSWYTWWPQVTIFNDSFSGLPYLLCEDYERHAESYYSATWTLVKGILFLKWFGKVEVSAGHDLDQLKKNWDSNLCLSYGFIWIDSCWNYWHTSWLYNYFELKKKILMAFFSYFEIADLIQIIKCWIVSHNDCNCQNR